MEFERNIKKQIDISLELLYALSKMRNTNLKVQLINVNGEMKKV